MTFVADLIEEQVAVFRMRRIGVVYVVDCPAARASKVGFTTRPQHRLATLQAGCPFDLVLRCEFPGDRGHEADFHAALTGDRVRGEWFTTAAVDGLLAELEAIQREREREVCSMEAMAVWRSRNCTHGDDESGRYVEYIF